MITRRRWVDPVGRTDHEARRHRAISSTDYRQEQERTAPYEALARMIVARRIRNGLTQAQLAEHMGTSVPAISRLESGYHRPNLETLAKLAQAFGERFVLGFENSSGVRDLLTMDR